jgi:hypothetical protein
MWREKSINKLDVSRPRLPIANLEPLYQRCLSVLQNNPSIPNIEDMNPNKVARLLKQHGMPMLCITCLKQFSNRELVRHLLSGREHIANLEAIKEEKTAVMTAFKEDPESGKKARLVFAVKNASLVRLSAGRRRR